MRRPVAGGGPARRLPPHRWSLRPSDLPALAAARAGGGRFVAEVGVGVVHRDAPQPAPPPVDPAVAVAAPADQGLFDPTGRLGPGRDPLAGMGAAA